MKAKRKEVTKPGLVVRRYAGERVFIGEDIEVTVEKISSSQVQLRFLAPIDVHIRRDDAISREPGHLRKSREIPVIA